MNTYQTLSLIITFRMLIIAVFILREKNNRPAPNRVVIV
ncbi:putative holin-like toxin [Thermoanaerobacterium thermosaccharolyticum]